jgi:Cu/Ag efflux protein CusF
MKIAKIMIAGTAALIAVHSAALAQEMLTGTVTKIDRISSTLTVQQTQSGTVGAGNGAMAEEFKVQDGAMLNDVHAGDRVSFSVTGTGDSKTITKLDKP